MRPARSGSFPSRRVPALPSAWGSAVGAFRKRRGSEARADGLQGDMARCPIATVAENANPLRIRRQARRSTVQDLLGPRGASVRYRSKISARTGGRFYCSADHAFDVRSSRGVWPEGSQNLGGLTGRRRRRPQPLQLIPRILETRGDTCLEKYISFGIQSMQRSTLVLLAVR